MPIPNLLHPIQITIEQWNVGDTLYDEYTREPIQQASRASYVTIQGQVSWNIKDEVVMGAGGAVLNAEGYILFRYVDLQSKGVVLKRQDAIKKIGWQDVNMYIVAFKPMGHYADNNGATLLKVFFGDRAPSRNVD